MGGGVDAPGHSGDDGDASPGQIASQTLRRRYSVWSGMSGSDHSDIDGGQEIHPAAREQDGWRVEDPAEEFGVAGISEGDEMDPGIADQLLLGSGVFKTAAAGYGTRQRTRYTGSLQLRGGGVENGTHAAKALQ